MTAITAPREAWISAVEAAIASVERRTKIAILANLLLVNDHGLRIYGTDLDITTSIEFPAVFSDIPEDGITVQANLLYDILRKLPAKTDVKLASEKDGPFKLTCGRSRFSLNSLPGADWPRLEQSGDAETSFKMSASHLAAMLAAISFAISTEETRYYLNGVYMHAKDDALITVATDGTRLARAVIDAPDGAQNIPGIIIPKKTVGILIKVLSDAPKDATITITICKNLVTFELGTLNITSKLIDGTFPDYERVIPQISKNQWRFDAATLASAADRISTISSDRGNKMKMTWCQSNLTLEAESPETGSGTENIDIDHINGAQDMAIGLNCKFLRETLAHIDGQAIASITDNGSPIRINPVHSETDAIEMTFILMPMRM